MSRVYLPFVRFLTLRFCWVSVLIPLCWRKYLFIVIMGTVIITQSNGWVTFSSKNVVLIKSCKFLTISENSHWIKNLRKKQAWNMSLIFPCSRKTEYDFAILRKFYENLRGFKFKFVWIRKRYLPGGWCVLEKLCSSPTVQIFPLGTESDR